MSEKLGSLASEVQLGTDLASSARRIALLFLFWFPRNEFFDMTRDSINQRIDLGIQQLPNRSRTLTTCTPAARGGDRESEKRLGVLMMALLGVCASAVAHLRG